MGKIQTINDGLQESYLLRPIYECLTPKMNAAFDGISVEIRELPLEELEKRLEPNAHLKIIKIAVWDEYAKTLAEDRKSLDISAICDGVCSREYFYKYVIEKELVLAWMFHPPTQYEKQAKEALDYGIPKIRRMLDAPLFEKNPDGTEGDFDNANAASVLNAMKFLDARVKGSPLQRIEQKSLHLHKNADNMQRGISRDEMRQELDALTQRLGGGVLQLKAPDETE